MGQPRLCIAFQGAGNDETRLNGNRIAEHAIVALRVERIPIQHSERIEGMNLSTTNGRKVLQERLGNGRPGGQRQFGTGFNDCRRRGAKRQTKANSTMADTTVTRWRASASRLHRQRESAPLKWTQESERHWMRFPTSPQRSPNVGVKPTPNAKWEQRKQRCVWRSA
jgi:hypothetical protein